MGNIFDQPEGDDQNHVRLDGMTKREIVNYIKKLETVKLDVGEEFSAQVKEIGIQNLKLVPMNIEFYERIKKVVPRYVAPKDKPRTRKYYVKPTFGIESVRADEVVLKETMKMQLLDKIPAPTKKYKNENITLLEYMEAFKDPTMKTDMMGISKKMLLRCQNYHKVRFINCYNKLYRGVGTSIEEINFGRAFYMYKEAKRGPKDDIKSFRKLVEIPTSINHYHRILAMRMTEYMRANDYIDQTIQKGGISGVKAGILEQIYKVKEVLKDGNERNKQVCVLYLDISNAFGNLKLSALKKILEEYHVHRDFINYVMRYYETFEYYAETREWSTELLSWKEGLIQGCPLSALLFVTALNYVLKYIDRKYKDECGYSYREGAKILLTAYMDDITIITTSMKKLEKVYTQIKFLFECMGLPINKAKSTIMTNKEEEVGFDRIPIVKYHKYLGEYIAHDGTAIESYTRFIKMLGRRLYALDAKQIESVQKMKFFTTHILPWIQRRMLAMYDLDRRRRINIVSLIKKYVRKWGNTEEIKLFCMIAEIMGKSEDTVIHNIKNRISDISSDDLELANSILSDKKVEFVYGDDIDENEEADKEIDEMIDREDKEDVANDV